MHGIKKIDGLVAAVFTPFDQSGRIDPRIIESYAARLTAQPITGVFVNGSSGEGAMLSVEERKTLAEKWIQCANKKFKVIVHVGSTSIEICKDLASHAQQAGADAVASMAPSFFPSSETKIIAAFCEQVAAAAPKLPFYYYHLPVATGTHIKVNKLFREVAERIPNFAGVKYTYNDFMDMHQCLLFENNRFDVLHGHDEMLINGLVLGIKGAIGTTFNFIPGVYNRIMEAYAVHDVETALAYQRKAIEVVEIMLKYNNAIVGGKAMMKLAGIDCGECRLPLKNLTLPEQEKMKAELNGIGFFDLVNMEGKQVA